MSCVLAVVMGSGGDGCVLVIGMLGVTRFVSCGVCSCAREGLGCSV